MFRLLVEKLKIGEAVVLMLELRLGVGECAAPCSRVTSKFLRRWRYFIPSDVT
jgi:hypothetical protein